MTDLSRYWVWTWVCGIIMGLGIGYSVSDHTFVFRNRPAIESIAKAECLRIVRESQP